jgi:hypothetical protein
MLNLNDPFSQIIFQASGHLDRIKLTLRALSVERVSALRLNISGSVSPDFEALRNLAEVHFPKAYKIPPSLQRLEEGVRKFASKPIISFNENLCAVCAVGLISISTNESICHYCTEDVLQEFDILESEEGFLTFAI